MKDLTMKLPDELWCHVFDCVSSLSLKFKLAAVSRRFRRCILKLLRAPMPLELDFRTRYYERLNGCRVPLCNWATAVKVLAEKTEFTSVAWLDLCSGEISNVSRFMATILQILIEADCLGRVASVKSEGSAFYYHHSELLQTLIAHCAKLQVLDLNSWIGPPNSTRRRQHTFQIRPDLSAALNNKSLTEVSLKLNDFEQASLTELFKGLVPHKLRRVSLVLFHISLDLGTLLGDLGESAWSAVEEIHLHAPMDLPPVGPLLLALVTSLPMLHRCHVAKKFDTQEFDQFVPAVVSMLNEANRDTELTVVYSEFNSTVSGCRVFDLVHQLRLDRPALQLDFDQDTYVEFELDRVWLCLQLDYNYCNNHHCVPCRCFYPNVIDRLAQLAHSGSSAHVEHHQLDRCRVDRVAADLNRRSDGEFQVTDVTIDQDLVTITLEDETYVSVECGECLVHPCLGCLIIDD